MLILSSLFFSVFFFFFQAEDGIRDTSVTGVQTCALPLCRGVGGDDFCGRAEGIARIRSAVGRSLKRGTRDRRARPGRRFLCSGKLPGSRGSPRGPLHVEGGWAILNFPL